MPFSDAYDNEVLDRLFGSGDPATWYLCLLESAWAKTQTGSTIDEPDGLEYVGYARVAVTNNVTNFPAAVARVKTLAVRQDFPAAGGTSTGFTASHWALADAAAAGQVVTGGALPTAVSITAGKTPYLPANELTIEAD